MSCQVLLLAVGHWCSRPLWRGKPCFVDWHGTPVLVTDLIHASLLTPPTQNTSLTSSAFPSAEHSASWIPLFVFYLYFSYSLDPLLPSCARTWLRNMASNEPTLKLLLIGPSGAGKSARTSLIVL